MIGTVTLMNGNAMPQSGTTLNYKSESNLNGNHLVQIFINCKLMESVSGLHKQIC